MEHTKSIERFNADADALFAPIMERAMASANQRLDARISPRTFEERSPRIPEDTEWVVDPSHNGSSDARSDAKPEE